MKLKTTTFEWIAEIIGFVLILGIFGYLFMAVGDLPNEIAIHYDADGAADQWGDKMDIFKLPLMGLVIYVFATILQFFPKRWNVGVSPEHKNAEKVYRATKDMIVVLKVEIAAIFAYTTFVSVNQQPMNNTILGGGLLFMFATIVLFMVKASKAKKEGMTADELMNQKPRLF